MALFKINKGLASNLAKNMPYAKEGFAYFTKDDGKFYIDIEGDGTTTEAIINVNRIPLNAAKADVATMIQATAMATDDNKVYPILAFNITDSTKNLVEAKYSQIGIKNGTLVIPSVEDKDEILISNEGLGRGIVIDNKGINNAIEILNGKGIKVAQDPTDDLELVTKQYVDNQNVVLELRISDGSINWANQTSYDFTLDAKALTTYSRLREVIEKGYTPTVIIEDIDNVYIYKYSFTQVLIITSFLIFAGETLLSSDGKHMGRDFIAFQSNASGTTLTVQRLNKPLEYVPGDGEANQILATDSNGRAKWSNIPSIGDLGGATKDHNHDDRYYTEAEIDDKLKTKSDVSHNHDSRYYTESEIDTKLKTKSDTGHTHDDRYYTETEVDNKLSKKSDTGHKHTKSDIIDFAHTHTKSDIIDFAHTHQNFSATRLNNEDLDNYLGADKMGWYYAGGSNNVSNKPSNVDAFGLLVWRSAEGYYTQTLVNANKDSSRIYTRQLSGSGTTPWITTYTSTEIDNKLKNVLSANDAMVFKGVVNSNADLPSTHETGWTYRVGTAGTYANAKCEIGDLLICITDGLSTDAKHWIAVQANIDGAVIGPDSATDNNIALFNGATGKLIKDSGKKISDFASSEHSHTITAKAKDDNIVVLTGTNGTNTVTYNASHAKKGPSETDTIKGPSADVSISGAGESGSITIPKVTVDAYGHTTGLTEQKLTITLPTAYSHPATPGNKHIPAGGSAGQILRWSANGTAAWGADNDTHHQSSTVITNGSAGISNAASSNGGTYLNHIENEVVRSTHKIVGAGSTKVSSDADGVLTITSENTVYSHPTTPGNIHLPAGGQAGDILLWADKGTGKWGVDPNIKIAIDNLNVDEVGGEGKYIQAIKQADGKIVATEKTIDIALNATSTKPVQNKVVQAALDKKLDTTTFDEFKKKLDGIEDGAEKNQPAFSNIIVNNGTTNVTIAAIDPTDSFTIAAGNNVTLTSDVSNKKLTIASTNTDTKVTAVGNHYTPATDPKVELSANASNSTNSTAATWGTTQLVTGVNLQRDAKGHVTGVTVNAIKMPANPNTDTHQTSKNIVGASTKATEDAAATNGNVYLNHLENNTITSKHKIIGTGGTSVTSDSSGNITINSPTAYSHPKSGVTKGTYKSVTVDEYGHVTTGTNPTTLAGFGITDAKKIQKPVSSPSATTNTTLAFIDTISQDAQGVITATKKIVQNATKTQAGAVSTSAQTFGGAKTFTSTVTIGESGCTLQYDATNQCLNFVFA